MNATTSLPSAARAPERPLRAAYKWELLTLFWFAYFLNQGARQVFNAVLPQNLYVDGGMSL